MGGFRAEEELNRECRARKQEHPDAHFVSVAWTLEPDRVFVRKVQDLRSRSTAAPDGTDPEYEILMAAPLLRELLIGAPPLMDTVNHDRRLKIRFRVARATAYERVVLEDSPVFFGRGDGLYPGTALPGAEIVALNRDQRLREMTMIVGGDTITIHNLIDYVANAAGAVHYGDLAEHKRAVIAAVDGNMRIGGLEVTLHALLAVSRVVADGLELLVARVEADAQL